VRIGRFRSSRNRLAGTKAERAHRNRLLCPLDPPSEKIKFIPPDSARVAAFFRDSGGSKCPRGNILNQLSIDVPRAGPAHARHVCCAISRDLCNLCSDIHPIHQRLHLLLGLAATRGPSLHRALQVAWLHIRKCCLSMGYLFAGPAYVLQMV
jgi:hypothetical protein